MIFLLRIKYRHVSGKSSDSSKWARQWATRRKSYQDRQADRQTATPPQQLTRPHNHFIPPSAPNPLHTTSQPHEPKFAQMRKPQHGIPRFLGLSSVMTHPPTPILLRPAAPFANALDAMLRRRASDAKSTRQQGPSPARALGTNTKGNVPICKCSAAVTRMTRHDTMAQRRQSTSPACDRWPCVSMCAVHHQTSRRLLNCEISCPVFVPRAALRCIWIPRVPLPRAPAFRTFLGPLGVPIRLYCAGCDEGRAGACRRIPSRIAVCTQSMCVVPMRHGQVVSDATQPGPRRGLVILESDAALAEMSRIIASRLPPAGSGACSRPHHVSWFRHRRYTSVSGRMGQVRV